MSDEKKMRPCLRCDQKWLTTAHVRICQQCKRGKSVEGYGWYRMARENLVQPYKVIRRRYD